MTGEQRNRNTKGVHRAEIPISIQFLLLRYAALRNVTALASQVTELARKPHRSHITPVANAPTASDGELQALLTDVQRGTISFYEFTRRSGYNGNKPSGGLWTSTYTPHDRYPSKWIAESRTPASLTAISAGRRSANQRRLFTLDVVPDAVILDIRTLADAADFTERYRLYRVPSIRHLSPILTAEVTDWAQCAGAAIDGIHLSDEAVRAIQDALQRGDAIDTAFHTWTVESTLWFRWAFCAVRELDA